MSHIVDALSESIGAYNSMHLTLDDCLNSSKTSNGLEDWKRHTATIKCDYNIDNFIKAFYTFSTDAKGKTEEELKTQYTWSWKPRSWLQKMHKVYE